MSKTESSYPLTTKPRTLDGPKKNTSALQRLVAWAKKHKVSGPSDSSKTIDDIYLETPVERDSEETRHTEGAEVECSHDFDNPKRLGRAHYHCRLCDDDISLDLFLLFRNENSTGYVKDDKGRVKVGKPMQKKENLGKSK